MSATREETPPTITTDPATRSPSTSTSKYPHTRAILVSIAATAKDNDSLDVDTDNDDNQKVSPAIVSRVVMLLQDENEDELKNYLKDAFSIPDSVVSAHWFLNLQ